MLISILVCLLKGIWWLFVASGFAAMMFCFSALVGYVGGVIRTKYPDYSPYKNTATKTELVLWAIVFALFGSIPFLNWIVAIYLFKHDDELVKDMIHKHEVAYELQNKM